jgi:hypothetical protein
MVCPECHKERLDKNICDSCESCYMCCECDGECADDDCDYNDDEECEGEIDECE